MKIAVVSSLYGEYDEPTPPVEQNVDCEWVLVTDRDYHCPPWRTVIEPRPQLHPRLAAKVAKTMPYLYAQAYAYVWVDASVRITSPRFVRWAVSHLDDAYPFAFFEHPDRQSISAEKDVSLQLLKYQGLPLEEQVAHYVGRGHPDDWGLWATGVYARRRVIRNDFGERWFTEQVRWTYQDQLSLPYVLHHMQTRPRSLSGPLFSNEHFQIRNHAHER